MKKVFFFAFLFTELAAFSQGSNELNFYFEHCTFSDLNGKSFIEIYLSVDATTVTYTANESGRFQASVNAIVKVQKDSAIIFADKFNLFSPEMTDTSLEQRQFNFLDLKRVMLEPGNYLISVSLKDNNLPDSLQVNYTALRECIIAPAEKDKISFSDIELYSKYQLTTSKNIFSKPGGIDIIPYVTNSSLIDEDTLNAYIELYHSDRLTDKYYFVVFSIQQSGSDQKSEAFTKTIRKMPKGFDIAVATFAVNSLASNSYVLTAEIIDSKNQLIKAINRKIYIYNTGTEADFTSSAEVSELYSKLYGYDAATLEYYIKTLRHVSSQTELSFVKVLSTDQERQNYFVNFWRKRAEEQQPFPYNPKTWADYKYRIDYANQKFRSALRDGYATDRGRVMAQYGPPNDIQSFPSDNNKYPYELWTYNKLGVQPGVIFVFWDPDLTTNEYRLLHSTKYGEPNNPRWRVDLVQRIMDAPNIDADQMNNDPAFRREFWDQTPK